MEAKLELIKKIFSQIQTENAALEGPPIPIIQHGKYYGGVYNGRKFMYSEAMIGTLPIEKLEQIIKSQIGQNDKA